MRVLFVFSLFHSLLYVHLCEVHLRLLCVLFCVCFLRLRVICWLEFGAALERLRASLANDDDAV